MKNGVIRCSECSNCAIVTPCGFAYVPNRYCYQHTRRVMADDGCTFGSLGENQSGVVEYDVSIESAKSSVQSCASTLSW